MHDSNGSEDPLVTKTENFEIGDIEQAQGSENMIIRNLDLEGDDYYEEEFLIDNIVHDDE